MNTMKITICSRQKAENLLREGFPANTAVISFHDPDKEPLDYSSASQRVLRVSLGDFEPSLPQSQELARFIYDARADGLDIRCQCESGRNRSAGCAAVILEHFCKTGSAIFDDDRYQPDEMVYYEVLDALGVHSKRKG